MPSSDGSPRTSIGRPWAVIEVVGDIGAIASEWDALAERVGADPFSRPGWFAAWCDAFGDDGRLGIVVLRGEEGRLRALAPLVRRADVTRAPTNEHTPSFRLLGEDADAVDELATILVRLRQRRLSLSPLDAEGESIAAVRRAGEQAGYRMVEQVELNSPHLPLEGVASADEALDRKMRKDLRRCRRRLEEAGELAVAVERGAENVDALLEEAFEVEGRQWKGEAGTAISSDPATRAFYEGIARWAAGRGTLRLVTLRLDGRLIAFEMDLLEAGALYSLKAGFDPEQARFSPGHLVAHAAVEEAIAAGARSYELLGDAEPYKLKWTGTCREMRSIEASPPTPAGTAEHLRMRFWRPVRRRLARRAAALRSFARRSDR
jgi:CelD/BcsL family acetyltransferase involved in cellulose biosynthesis